MTLNDQAGVLDRILANRELHSLFQPIVSLSERRILGYEALIRGASNTPLQSPLPLYATARQAGRLSELEIAARQQSCQTFRELALDGLLFLNVCPETLLEPAHQSGQTLKLLQRLGLSPAQVVIELTEQAPIDDFALLATALHHYRAMGFSIALDDLGAGYSSLRRWSELRPDFVKIDRHFIESIHRDAVKREFVGSILKMAEASRAQVIAEGIETHEELSTLASMGVDLVQGYLLGRPTAAPPREIQTLLPVMEVRSSELAEESTTVASLRVEQVAVGQDMLIPEVLERFRLQPSLNTLAVVDEDDRPVGIVHHHELSSALLKPFAHEVFARKPIARLMSQDFLATESGQSLQQVSRLLTARARQRIEEDFIITEGGRYVGVGRVMDVLRLITEQRIQQAKHANPLTQLPGNVPIQQCLTRLLDQQREAVVCYVDIDGFKPFNDLYGYAKGDEVLLCLAQTLSERLDPQQDFVGHIGGDDFLVVLGSADWRRRLNGLMAAFQERCRHFYRSEHLEAGCFLAYDRDGRRREYPLLSLSLGVVELDREAGQRVDASGVAALASEAKRNAKMVPGYSLHLMRA